MHLRFPLLPLPALLLLYPAATVCCRRCVQVERLLSRVAIVAPHKMVYSLAVGAREYAENNASGSSSASGAAEEESSLALSQQSVAQIEVGHSRIYITRYFSAYNVYGILNYFSRAYHTDCNPLIPASHPSPFASRLSRPCRAC